MDRQALHADYYTYLEKFFPLYKGIGVETLERCSHEAVDKAIDRGMKFNVLDMAGYMEQACSIYFKALLEPNQTEVRLSTELINYMTLFDSLYDDIEELSAQTIDDQTEIWAHVLEVTIFQARLLYHCFRKMREGTLRQVDADLTSVLLPKKKRGQYEVIQQSYDITEVKAEIVKLLK